MYAIERMGPNGEWEPVAQADTRSAATSLAYAERVGEDGKVLALRPAAVRIRGLDAVGSPTSRTLVLGTFPQQPPAPDLGYHTEVVVQLVA